MNPEAEESTASGSGEIDAGELGTIEVDYDINYTYDGNAYGRGDYKITAFLPLAKDPKQIVAVDFSSLITESAIDLLLEDHLF